LGITWIFLRTPWSCGRRGFHPPFSQVSSVVCTLVLFVLSRRRFTIPSFLFFRSPSSRLTTLPPHHPSDVPFSVFFSVPEPGLVCFSTPRSVTLEVGGPLWPPIFSHYLSSFCDLSKGISFSSPQLCVLILIFFLIWCLVDPASVLSRFFLLLHFSPLSLCERKLFQSHDRPETETARLCHFSLARVGARSV